jgi:hypothetical protein
LQPFAAVVALELEFTAAEMIVHLSLKGTLTITPFILHPQFKPLLVRFTSPNHHK